ncbi:hypothetical protein P3T21_005373 [Paraburkholderia sp. GAS334]
MDRSKNHERLSLAVFANVDSVRRCLHSFDEKRPENGIFRCLARPSVIDGVDQHRYAKYIRQENELLSPVGAQMTGIGKELDGSEPFVVSGFDLFNCRM